MGALNPKLARTQGILSQHTTPTPRFKTVSLSEVFAQKLARTQGILSQHTTPTPRFKTVSLSEVFAQ
ncbi:hypothetical protein PPTG_23421 [Phytophthora nicotianae INRA-310]|uniref:Uncharacterized protein n=1 Tax=Phytophthora nicotianae (strain INRA-310) TaxID=761204 RepID=W2PXR0_PHYN3|nr:hypothetical protein PPTG_23421 [Phytophthora nicotianae INRA-310]ETN05738.1 hypothetical protein PPTG_23421 [Phytophthora nicotianae INRA-310]